MFRYLFSFQIVNQTSNNGKTNTRFFHFFPQVPNTASTFSADKFDSSRVRTKSLWRRVSLVDASSLLSVSNTIGEVIQYSWSITLISPYFVIVTCGPYMNLQNE